MPRFGIAVFRFGDDIIISVSKDGKFYDMAEFHVGERDEFVDYMRELGRRIHDEVISDG